jgi:thiamine-phosphate pyrophosphorylase
VVEDICRFILNDEILTKTLKNIRHSCKTSLFLEALSNRDIIGDCSRSTTKTESSRSDIQAILIANFKRAEESSRVLEELLKLHSIEEAENFKLIRYALYDTEKQIVLK